MVALVLGSIRSQQLAWRRVLLRSGVCSADGSTDPQTLALAGSQRRRSPCSVSVKRWQPTLWELMR
ncbi:hypothetical protein ZHAS_00018286 [Anopheles sinensis]|uniref:Uncharacterized protein n=1 Tax=Anopheles sinensis TaxID=74873 RepID=A0A084WJ23_ANOSI|nr:hypothetical protein ZHAS_00018286 [Anopheles sinensis]